MRKNLLTFGTALLLLSGAIFTDAASAAGMVSLGGHVPSLISHLTAKGLLPGTNQLNLAIGLPVRNPQDLSNLLEQVYDPASPNYHQYLTPDQFASRFGPTEQDYQAVISFAQAHGLVVTGTHPNRMVLDVRGTASDVEGAFNVSLKVYHHPTESRDFYAPDIDPSVPQTLPILDISGLDNYRRPYPNFRLKPKSASANVSSGSTVKAAHTSQANVSPQATTGSGPFGNYIGDDFRTAYVPGTSLNGSGQTIALVQFDGYLASDIHEYESLSGRTNIPLQNILIDGFSGVPTSNNQGGEVEVSLDIEMVISMAPALSKVILYEGNPFNFFPNDVLNRIATDNTAHQVSSSWSWSGGPSATTDQIFQQMALQGQSYFNAVGDQDAYTAGANSPNGVDNPDVPHAPGDSPYITEVGGTTLTMSGAGVSYQSETVWNWDVRFGPAADGEGTCGGISSFYAIPNWQTNINMRVPQGSSTFRNSPDVALTADDVLVIADGGVEYDGTGGTSCATPLWAGFTALINQQGTNNGFNSVGFINPALYAIAARTNYNSYFHDVTTGNNAWSGSPNLFSATPGYDLCTGLGTPNGTNLINALTGITGTLTNSITHLSAPPPPYGATLSVLNGSNPNGNWELFIQDDQPLNTGVISNGWWVTITTANPVGSAADAAVTMTSSSSSIGLNDDVSYFITVTNYGPSASTNVILTDALPAGSAFVSATSTLGSVNRTGLNVIWTVGTPSTGSDGTAITVLATNAGAQLTITVQGNSVGSMFNIATVNSDTPDPNPDDNSKSTEVSVVTATTPELSGSFASNGTFQLSVSGVTGQQYIVEATTNLSSIPINWVPIATNAAPFTFTDPNSSGYATRFYQVVPAP